MMTIEMVYLLFGWIVETGHSCLFAMPLRKAQNLVKAGGKDIYWKNKPEEEVKKNI